MKNIFLTLSLLIIFLGTGCNDFLTKDIVLGARTDDTEDDGTGGDGDGDGDADPIDSDGDNLSNEVEELFRMNPFESDSDGDGYGDGLEFVGLNGDPLDASFSPVPIESTVILPDELVVDTSTDRDLDGIGDALEVANSLDPDDPDVDNDGYGDGLELVAGSDPLDSESRPVRTFPPNLEGIIVEGDPPVDDDNDGLSNDLDVLFGNAVDDVDTDRDGYGDGIEALMGSAGNDPSEIPVFAVPFSQ